MNATVVLLQKPDTKFGKAVQLKLVGIQQAAATMRVLGEGPTHSQFCSSRFAVETFESALGSIALAALINSQSISLVNPSLSDRNRRVESMRNLAPNDGFQDNRLQRGF